MWISEPTWFKISEGHLECNPLAIDLANKNWVIIKMEIDH